MPKLLYFGRHALDRWRRVLFDRQRATLPHCENVGVFLCDPLEKVFVFGPEHLPVSRMTCQLDELVSMVKTPGPTRAPHSVPLSRVFRQGHLRLQEHAVHLTCGV